jgi:hypothetical protein
MCEVASVSACTATTSVSELGTAPMDDAVASPVEVAVECGAVEDITVAASEAVSPKGLAALATVTRNLSRTKAAQSKAMKREKVIEADTEAWTR